MILIKSFLPGVLYDCFKLIYEYLNEGDMVRACYSCLKMIIEAHLHVGFFAIFFINRASLRWFYLYMKLLQSSTIFKQSNNHEVAIKIFAWFFYIPNSKNITATVCTIEKFELILLLMLYCLFQPYENRFCLYFLKIWDSLHFLRLSLMELFVKIVDSWGLLAIFQKAPS